eukprot:10306429-Ditylum_brightwellii.AAC.1
MHFIGHIFEGTLTGAQIMIALSKVQLVSGSGWPFLKEVKTEKSYVQANWLSTMRTFLHMCSVFILIPEAWIIKKQRENNKMLMGVFEEMKPLSDTLEKLNAVRLYLGVCTLVDICDEAGTQIKPWALSGFKQAKSMILWPNQAWPSDRCWVVWRNFLKSVFAPLASKSHQRNKPITLQTALGEWTTSIPYTARAYYYDPNGDNIYAVKGSLFHKFTLARKRVIWFNFFSELHKDLPQSAIITKVLEFGSILVCREPLQIA